MNPDGFTYSDVGGVITGTPTGGVVAAGNTDVFTVVLLADSSDANDSTITNTASVSTTISGSTAANETSSVTTTLTTSADFSVTETGPSTSTDGSVVTYTVTVRNAGPSDSAATLTDTLSPSLAITGATPGAVVSGNTVTFSIADLVSGGSEAFGVSVRATETGNVQSTATVSAFDDPNPANNTQTVATAIGSPAAPPASVTNFPTGSGGTVHLFNLQTGQAASGAITPFAGFTGDIRVATAVFNGRALNVYAEGPGGDQVEVVDVASGAVLYRFDAFDPGFTGGVFVAVADVNNDGTPDLIVGAGAGGGPEVKIIDGTKLNQVNTAGEIEDSALLTTNGVKADFFAFDPSFHGGVSVAVGDVNGDGYADVILGAGAGAGSEVKVVDGAALAQAPFDAAYEVENSALLTTNGVLDDFFAYAGSFSGGVRVGAVDVNGDGHADLIVGAGPGGGPEVKVIDDARLNQVVPMGQPNANEIENSALLDDFFANDPLFPNGVFV